MRSFFVVPQLVRLLPTRTFLAAVYGLLACFSTMTVAQTTLDLDPPVVEHTAPASLASGKPVNITAIVTDDSGIDEVTLYHRATVDGPFAPLEMTVTEGDEYAAQLPTQKKQKALFYYIEVVDSRGNRLLEGAPDSPFAVQEKKRSNIMYMVLGAVAVGALVAAAGGGDESGPEPGPNTRPFSITANPPE